MYFPLTVGTSRIRVRLWCIGWHRQRPDTDIPQPLVGRFSHSFVSGGTFIVRLLTYRTNDRGVAFGTTPLSRNIFISDASQYLPRGFLTWLFERDNSPGSVRLRENGKYAREVAKGLIDAKRNNMRNGEVGKDVLSLLSTCFRECWRFIE